MILLSSMFVPSCKRQKEEITGAAVKVLKSPEKMRVVQDLHLLRRAIEEYRIEHNGNNPSSLKDLGIKLYYPNEYFYHRETGTVRSKKYPNL